MSNTSSKSNASTPAKAATPASASADSDASKAAQAADRGPEAPQVDQPATEEPTQEPPKEPRKSNREAMPFRDRLAVKTANGPAVGLVIGGGTGEARMLVLQDGEVPRAWDMAVYDNEEDAGLSRYDRAAYWTGN